ncbi:MAG: hypothetical protein NTV25_10075 [Methanothrix sp.]|nr:hypothetical protein [Methanothrix sp.]
MMYTKAIIFAVLAAAILSVMPISLAENGTSSSKAANGQLQSDQTPAEPGVGDLLYSDDFSSSKSGWPQYSKGDFSALYKNGKYHETAVPALYWNFRIFPRLNFSDFVLEVEATKEAGPDDNAFGVLVREFDAGRNSYAFLLSSDGYYQVKKAQNNSWVYVPDWAKSSAIKTGNATNIVKVVCNGDKFSFYANGVKLTDYNDSSYANGHIALAVESKSEGNVTIGFDNLTVRAIK